MITVRSAGWSQEEIKEALTEKQSIHICRIIGHAKTYEVAHSKYDNSNLYTKFEGWFHIQGCGKKAKTATVLALPREDASDTLKVIIDTSVMETNEEKGVEFVVDIHAVKTNTRCGYCYEVEWLKGAEMPERFQALIDQHSIPAPASSDNL